MKLIHCSYHKCLTVYFQRVFSGTYNTTLRWNRGYRHFYSLLDDFYQESTNYKVSSINNHTLDLSRLGHDARVTRFVRDPRDLVVSGYFYHKRGAEEWSRIASPSDADWAVVNGCVPDSLPQRTSYSSYLKNTDK
ncbi:MAG: hypothetical protein HRT77_15725 [Halioglobus sp.]|nr:hypothetical protein [Halioglobus sp.]